MRPIRTVGPFLAASFESLGSLLTRHRGVARVSLAALSFVLVIAFSQQGSTSAGPDRGPLVPESLLPRSVGMAVATDDSVTIPFDVAMEPASVESAIQVLPGQHAELAWNEDRTALTVTPERLWHADESYLVVIPASSETADGDTLRAPRRFSFTTEAAPAVTDFQVRLASADLPVTQVMAASDIPSVRSLSLDAEDAEEVIPEPDELGSQPPSRTASEVSATSSISISFSAEMDRADVEEHFAISPEIAGDLSWSDGELVFSPTERLAAGARYTISLIGAHDRTGNVLGGKGNFSFTVQAGAQLTTTEPKLGATGVEPTTVEMWFSQPMDVAAANAAFSLTDTSTGAAVAGNLEWNEAETQVTYVPDATFPSGTTFEVAFASGASDADGNPVSMRWSFTTTAARVAAAPTATARASTSTRSAPAVPPPAPASTAAGYAVNQINAARAAYGFGPVVLDEAISAVAYAHAYDQAVNGYFSHTGLDGSTRESRLAAGGIGFGWSGENQCYLVGGSAESTLDWCHASFMSEPYPGQFNHIANVLNPNARRVGVGIAQVGAKFVIVWDFTD